MKANATNFTHDYFAFVLSSEKYHTNELFRQFTDIMIEELDLELLSELGLSFMTEKLIEAFDFFTQTFNRHLGLSIERLESPVDDYGQSVRVFLHMKDYPYIVDSILEYLSDKNLELLSFVHPIIGADVTNDMLTSIHRDNTGVKNIRSFSWFVIESLGDMDIDTLKNDLGYIIGSIERVSADMPNIKALMFDLSRKKDDALTEDLRASEGRQLFKWMLRDNVFLLGAASLPEHKLKPLSGWDDFDECRGMLKPTDDATNDPTLFNLVRNGLMQFSMVTLKFNLLELPLTSPVYRRVKIILCMHKGADKNGQGMFFIFPLVFTHASLYFKMSDIPVARLKMNGIFEKHGITNASYTFRDAENFFMEFPRSEIFRMDRDELSYILEHLFTNAWKYREVKEFFYSRTQRNYLHITVIVPSSNYFPGGKTTLRKHIFAELGVKANYEYRFEYAEKIYIHFVYWGDTLQNVAVNEGEITRLIRNTFVSWDDRVKHIVDKSENTPLKKMIKPGGLYHRCFPENYIVENSPDTAFTDLEHLIVARADRANRIFFHHVGGTRSIFTLYSNDGVSMRKTIGMLEKCRLYVTNYDEYDIDVPGKQYVFRYTVRHIDIVNDDAFEKRVNALLSRLIQTPETIDEIYALVAFSGMNYRAIQILQIYRNYFVQIIRTYRLNTLNEALLEHADIARTLKDYFLLKFHPSNHTAEHKNEERLGDLKETLNRQCGEVRLLSSDFILRVFASLIESTVRTNMFQTDRTGIAVKINCAASNYIPRPKMHYEIFVSDGAMQGIHMRGSIVSRGGIRFSDRPDDFRVEVLQLAQAQMLKNAIIVPSGAKGGYSIAKKWATRDAMLKDSEYYYRRYIRSLLSLTDNIVDGRVVSPPLTVCYDGDDPYFVVAADKGTASYSDIANEISKEFNFWLGDAFASGGSSGYGHKSLAITAKGAWECVKRHFTESGKHIETEPFTVVGIGDMSGDVFGNGMLLSTQIKLLGAFNHLHIFVDPTPDPATAFEERRRIFQLPSSTWQSYDVAKISPGGGIFERQAKTIPLSREMKILLKTDASALSGIELIRRLLKLNTDLLWNGGIGTYIKASGETDLDVGDNQNNDVRVNANEINARIIGEGGNLGITPKGRIEYEWHGGRINADSIDNSAGVNLSDHEVNTKILLQYLMEKKQIRNHEERNAILAELSADMVELCLKDSVDNSLMISMDQKRSLRNIGFFIAEIEHLEKIEGLNRIDENIPDNKYLILLYRENRPIPRSTLSVISGYTKNYVNKRIVNSAISDHPNINRYFETYFPKKLRERYNVNDIPHRLKREIISMRLANYFVNTGGVAFIAEFANMTRRRSHEIVMGFLIIDDLFDGQNVERWIRSIDSRFSDRMFDWMRQKEVLFKQEIIWLLNNHRSDDITFALVDTYRESIKEIGREILNRTSPDDRQATHDSFPEAVTSDPAFAVQCVLPIFHDKHYLELASLKLDFDLNLSDAEFMHREIEELFALRILESKLIVLKTSSPWEITHLGLLIMHINRIRRRIYRQILHGTAQIQSTKQCMDMFAENFRNTLKKLSVTKSSLLREEEYVLSGIESYLHEIDTGVLCQTEEP